MAIQSSHGFQTFSLRVWLRETMKDMRPICQIFSEIQRKMGISGRIPVTDLLLISWWKMSFDWTWLQTACFCCYHQSLSIEEICWTRVSITLCLKSLIPFIFLMKPNAFDNVLHKRLMSFLCLCNSLLPILWPKWNPEQLQSKRPLISLCFLLYDPVIRKPGPHLLLSAMMCSLLGPCGNVGKWEP